MPDTKSERAVQLREKILDLVTEFYAEEFPSKPFVPDRQCSLSVLEYPVASGFRPGAN